PAAQAEECSLVLCVFETERIREVRTCRRVRESGTREMLRRSIASNGRQQQNRYGDFSRCSHSADFTFLLGAATVVSASRIRASAPACTLVPEQEEGPYYIDFEKVQRRRLPRNHHNGRGSWGYAAGVVTPARNREPTIRPVSRYIAT